MVEPLNDTASPYGPINRIVAGAWAETVSPQPYLVVLDTDTVFLGEPRFVRADAGVRPVDVKGSASSGVDDPLDAYWTRMCALGGIDPSQLPRITTAVDNISIRASYNSGFAVLRRDRGILQRTREIFFGSLSENLRPLAGRKLNILASTGLVGLQASEWWGSSQAALSVAIWSKTSDVYTFDDDTTFLSISSPLPTSPGPWVRPSTPFSCTITTSPKHRTESSSSACWNGSGARET